MAKYLCLVCNTPLDDDLKCPCCHTSHYVDDNELFIDWENYMGKCQDPKY